MERHNGIVKDALMAIQGGMDPPAEGVARQRFLTAVRGKIVELAVLPESSA